MAGFTELFVDQGASYSTTINLTDDVTNSNLNITGYSVLSQMRRSYYSANATANLTCTISDANNGEITLSLTAGQTANIKSGRYLFDLKIYNGTGTVTRVMEGIITITPGITR